MGLVGLVEFQMIISNESMDFNDPKELDDPQLFDNPQLFDDRLEVWTLIIKQSTVIPPSLMVLYFQLYLRLHCQNH